MRWPPYRHVFFDCDSTLTTVEGIDVLAGLKGKGWRVGVLTEAAMSGEVALEDVYAKRLRTLKPTRGQIQALRQVYKQNIVEDAQGVIQALKALGHRVYIISGGLAEPVTEFGLYLGVPREQIRAVPVEYDSLAGQWWQNVQEQPNEAERYLDYSEDVLTLSSGKAEVVRLLLGDRLGRTLLVGDGVSDLLVGETVDLFVGFGGVVTRERVAQSAPSYVTSESLAPVLALAAGPRSLKTLENSEFRELAVRAKSLIANGAITFQDEQLKAKFERAYQAVHSRTD